MLLLKLSVLCLSMISGLNSMSGSFSVHDKKKGLGIVLVSDLEVRKDQRDEIEKNLAPKKRRSDELYKIATDSLKNIENDLIEAKEKVKTLSEVEADLLNKKIMILNDRKQTLIDLQNLSREYIDLTERHRKLVEEFIDFLQAPRQALKHVYQWKEFRDWQIRISENTLKIQSHKEKRENIKKKKAAAYERLTSAEKQRDVKNKELEKLVAQATGGAKQPSSQPMALKYEIDVLAQEVNTLDEKIKSTNLLIEKLDEESRYWDDFIELEQDKLHEQKVNLDLIESRLILDYNDVEIAKLEWKNQVQRTFFTKEEINKLEAPKKIMKEKLSINLEVLRQRLAEIKQKENKDQISYLSIKSQLRNLSAQLHALESEILLLDAKKELANILANEKEQQFKMVELRYKLRIKEEDLAALFGTFKNKKDLALSALRELKEKQEVCIKALTETNRAIEKISLTKEKLEGKRPTIFMGQDASFNTILKALDQTKGYLVQKIGLEQSFLGVNADLINHQDKIINQYKLIVNELERRHKSYSIWKRSPHAISLEDLGRAALEAEAFFKNLFWETPAHFKLSAIFAPFRSFTIYDFLVLLSILLLYAVAFVGCRFALIVMRNSGKLIVDRSHGYQSNLLLNLILMIINFVLENFTLLFSWFFIFFHITTKFRYSLAMLSPFMSNYSIALFYLFSIPLLVYLANRFIQHIKELNRQLQDFFFNDVSQHSFIFLISIFCYATVILLPLNHSILAYTDAVNSNIVTVIRAAYIFVLTIVACLLLLNKDRILSWIPSDSNFFIWFKRKIDKHFYPFFIFIIGLCIILNPYIGYSNMAWFLAFAVPSSVALLYLLFLMHFYIRKYSVFLFMKEEDDEMIDKFEHAKAYYGFFIIFSFLALIFLTFIFVSRLWGIGYTPTDMWQALSEQWVIRIGIDNKLGLIEFIIFAMFLTGGFFVSSFIHRFVLNRLFDILRSEPGTQNTISRIVHYTTIFVAIVLGLNAVHLNEFIWWVLASFSIVLGLAMKDIASDFLAGFFVLIERPIEIGNYIQVDNIQGTVHKISARSTTVITSRNHSVIIPNKDLITKWVVNWGHGRFAVGFEINVRVAHKVDPDLVKKTLVSVIQAHPFILKVPGIVVRLEDFEDDVLYFLVRAFISARRVKEQWEIAAVLRTEILKAFKDQGIDLAKPERAIEFMGSTVGQSPKAIEIKFDQ